ncbi:MAG: CBS domain-containing protein [Alphaproteobacteria bacterium]|nr:CBS domain-containing protein [Alphaproteobacteria bacterium]
MDVAGILRRKGSSVVTVSPDSPVSDVVALLNTRRIGVVVVSRDGRTVEGIISERDVVRGLAQRGAAILAQPVREVMTSPVRTCRRSDSIDRLMSDMTDRRIRHLPVVEDGTLCGIVSIGDLVKTRLDEIEHEASALREYVGRA